jgi:hypothetical protein
LARESELKIEYTRRAVLQGVSIYAAGDAAAMLVLGDFDLTRLIGLMIVGATVYALEIPNYFRWIDNTVTTQVPWKRAAARTALAVLYFNPLWIARHLCFIHLASGRLEAIRPELLAVGLESWLALIPAAVVGNYVIQVKLPLRWRFFGSALFSALTAVYYALGEVIFNG